MTNYKKNHKHSFYFFIFFFTKEKKSHSVKKKHKLKKREKGIWGMDFLFHNKCFGSVLFYEVIYFVKKNRRKSKYIVTYKIGIECLLLDLN